MTDLAPPETPDAPAEVADGAPSPRADLTPAAELDCRGLNCPLPILKTKKAIMGIASGDILKVVATDPGSIPDMAAFSRRTGHQIVEQSEGGGEYVFFLRRA
jgi:tRNA 2-thiouridine synthesizing protein A